MAVEIKELIIKAVVADGESSGESSGQTDHERLVQECVDQVLKILKKTANR